MTRLLSGRSLAARAARVAGGGGTRLTLGGVPIDIPLGILFVAVLCAVAVYYAIRRLRRGAHLWVPVHALEPDPVPVGTEELRAAVDARRRSMPPPDDSVGDARAGGKASGRGPVRRLAELTRQVPSGAAMPTRRGYSAYVLPPAVEGKHALQAPATVAEAPAPPPARQGFGWRIAIAYVALALPFLAWSPYFSAKLSSWFFGVPFPSPAPPAVPYFFSFYDVLVQDLGNLVYWPLPWPAPGNYLAPPDILAHTVADYIFTMYLLLLLAFVLASGLARPGRYSPAQRWGALGVVVGFVFAEMLTDVFFYSIGTAFAYSSLALVARAFVGGAFFALLLFTSLAGPPPQDVRAGFSRRSGDVGTFLGAALASVALATLVLLLVYPYLGLGSGGLLQVGLPGAAPASAPFAILLLMPLLALLFYAFIGRALYEREVRARPTYPLTLYHPPVSILIPAYNEEASIADTIRAADIAARRYPGSVEILVGNDGSRDRTSEVARQAMSHLHHSHGHVIDLPHGGKSNALNGALRAARGEVVVRVDADTRISPERGFSAMIPPFSDPLVGGVQGLILPLQQEGWTRKLRMLEIVWNHLFLRRAYYGSGTAQVVDGAYCAFRRSDLLALGGWVPWNGEDTEITYRLQRVGFRFRYETGAVAYEDVPATYPALKKQRIRWTRGSYFAHHRHYPGLLSDTPEFGGIALLLWLAIFIRGGMRHLVYIYAALLTFLLGLQTLWHIGLVIALLLVPRGLVMAYYLVRLRAFRFLPWILTWPFTSALKQFIAMEGYGTILPGAIPEFSE